MNIKDNENLLTPAQKALLEQCAHSSFMLGGFVSLNDILTKLKVDVFVEPGKPERSVDDYYERAIKYWKKVLEQLRVRYREDNSLWDEYQKAEVKLWKLNVERKAHAAMKLLGLYDSKKNIIKLFPEAMADADASRMDEYLVSTFAHEVMHAYFNRPGHDNYPYAMFVEEPLAEFGMLLYVHETKNSYYNWAHDNVSSKKCCYRYGADIMDQYLDGDESFRSYLEEYKIPINEYEMVDNSNGRIYMPGIGGNASIYGHPLTPEWTPAPGAPTYFWDDATKTLGLDGMWCDNYLDNLDRVDPKFHLHRLIDCPAKCPAKNVYLGKNFVKECINSYLEELFSSVPVTVATENKVFTSINGILVRKDGNKPEIKRCGEGLYELRRNGKYGIIDSNLKEITEFKYDSIWYFQKNGLCMVRIDMPDGYKYGYVNTIGEEQIAVKYDNIYSFENGLAVAEMIGLYGIINEQDEVVVPFNLNYPDMRGLRNGYATMKDHNGKWGAIDANGQPVIPCEYDSPIWFDEKGIAHVNKNGELFLINTKGERLS